LRVAVSAVVVAALSGAAGTGYAQRGRPTGLGDGPWSYRSGDMPFRAVIVTKALVKPWSLAFLPYGSMLGTELGGKLRIIRKGVLDPNPIAGGPVAYATRLVGLMDIALHPQFAQNGRVYISYTKQGPDLLSGAEPVVKRVPNAAQQGGSGKT